LAVTGRYVIERGNAFTNKTDQVGVGENTHGKLVPVEWKGPYLTGLSSVSDWINSSKESPPAPVQLQVQ
jgi:hypothetical protein